MTYATIVIDPPWPLHFGEDRNRQTRPSTSVKGRWRKSPWRNYPTMTLEEIRTLPLKDLAAKDAHVYVWVPNRFIREVYDIVRGWGFHPSALLTWAKTPRGLGLGGAYVQTTEHILYCRRGSLPPKERIATTWWNWKRPEQHTGPKHSRKPEGFQDLVEQVSPGPYLELFARRKRAGWHVWGNEVQSDISLTLPEKTLETPAASLSDQ